ncbi:hypothetical protein GQ54DRAFT_298862 [Martensiomyces pterosporus]|nr:hypothetical protein GQ54DRAFT_300739 [Martensiomyces pterosporus]KAI8320112.1 hypothetical protein GQ54DRAFT_298862 [Martensiomyces pterosporus]
MHTITATALPFLLLFLLTASAARPAFFAPSLARPEFAAGLVDPAFVYPEFGPGFF